jgi:hypothetical protein
MPDEDGEHELTFELFGKKSEHTKIDDTGKLYQMPCLNIEMDF